MSLDEKLRVGSDEYMMIKLVTDYITLQKGQKYRHIYDVMREIKSKIPADIFSQYSDDYLHIINDSLFRAPEVFSDSWKLLQNLLMKIELENPNEPFTSDIKRCFRGEMEVPTKVGNQQQSL